MRKLPNIIITGTPGVGKSTHASYLAQHNLAMTSSSADKPLGPTRLEHVCISEYARRHNCISGTDSQLASQIVDEDALLDALERDAVSENGGYILDWHACDLFPERWIDLVVVVRCATEVLYDRLVGRAYAPAKLQQNMDAEIMQVLLDEARDGFVPEIVVELTSDSTAQLDANVARIALWADNWIRDRQLQEVEDEDKDDAAPGPQF